MGVLNFHPDICLAKVRLRPSGQEPKPMQRRADAAQVQGNHVVTYSNSARTRGAFGLLPCPMIWA